MSKNEGTAFKSNSKEESLFLFLNQALIENSKVIYKEK